MCNKLNATIIELPKIELIGLAMDMSLTNNQTKTLFQRFMPLRSKVELQSTLVYDLIYYPENYFQNFNPNTSFIKVAALEYQAPLPSLELERFTVAGGLYARFKNPYGFGNPQVYNEIYNNWLPSSKYTVDHRPHFDRFIPQKEMDNIQEEIFIPIKKY